MRDITIPPEYNYIGIFLTLDCGYRCSYCINDFGGRRPYEKPVSGEEWIRSINRIVSRDDLPVTIQGGEPSMHDAFIDILNNIKPQLKIDILTNIQFDVDTFIKKVDPERIKRDAPYASIRVSYHPEVMDLDEMLSKVVKMREAGFSIGVWGVLYPGHGDAIFKARGKAVKMGIDFRTKEFLGYYKGVLYGTYKYAGACERKAGDACLCRTTELIIGPSGSVYKCHSDLYEHRNAIGSLLEPDFNVDYRFLPCGRFGYCNPCDIKIKTNRFQQAGHTSVEIRR